MYLVYKVVAKLTHLEANIGGHITTWLPGVRSMTKQNSIWSKALIMLVEELLPLKVYPFT